MRYDDYIRDTELTHELEPGECHPLHWACDGGHVEIVEYLLDVCNVSVDMEDNCGCTPLMMAASSGQEAVVKSLIRRNADLNKINYTGKTALHYAVSKNRITVAELLILNDADVNAVDYKTLSTPLYRAASKGHLAIARSLIEKKCKLDTQNVDGDTPLHIACREERKEIAELLVQCGASTTLRNRSNMTPIYMAPNYLKLVLAGYTKS